MTEGGSWCITGPAGAPNPAAHRRALEDGRELLTTGTVSSPGQPPARLLKWTVGVGHTSEGKEDRDGERT